jgi:hypothetical protein
VTAMETHEIVFIGANPAVLLRDAGTATGFASLWFVDWSPHGAGRVLVLVHGGRVRVLGARPELGRWLVETFVRHFGEVRELTWGEPEYQIAEVEATLDLEAGVVVRAGDVGVEISHITGRQPFHQDGLTLGETTYELSNVSMPCERAWIEVGGERIPGEPSPAFLAVAEVWATQTRS